MIASMQKRQECKNLSEVPRMKAALVEENPSSVLNADRTSINNTSLRNLAQQLLRLNALANAGHPFWHKRMESSSRPVEKGAAWLLH